MKERTLTALIPDYARSEKMMFILFAEWPD